MFLAETFSELCTRHCVSDMIACFGEVTGQCAFRHMQQQMESCEEGRRILTEQPRINTRTVDYKGLLNKPRNTLGFAYSNFMKTYASVILSTLSATLLLVSSSMLWMFLSSALRQG